MGLDFATLALTIVLTAIVRLCVISTLYVLNRRYEGIGLWALASAGAALGFALGFVREWFSLPDGYAIAQSTLLAAAIALEYAGTTVFFAGKPNWRLAGSVVAAMFAGLVFLAFADGDWSVRSVFVHGVLAYLSLLTASVFLHNSLRTHSLMARFMGSVLTASGLLYIVMAILSLVAAFGGTPDAGPVPVPEALADLVIEALLTVGFALLVGQRLTNEMGAAGKHFEMLYQMTPEATAITTPDLTITRINEAFLSMTGLVENEVIGKNLMDFFSMDPRESRAHHDTLWRVGHDEDAEFSFRAGSGETLTILASARVLRTENATQVIVIARDVTQSRKLEAELERQARTDALTHLANRRQFMDLAERELARSLRSGHPTSVAIMDLDGMKEINDTYGHAAGDEVLIAVAEVGEHAVRSSDLFARFGGDEFVILLPEAGVAASAEVSGRVCAALLNIESKNQVPSGLYRASCGVATAESSDESLDAVLGRADAALYRAKAAGGGRVEVA